MPEVLETEEGKPSRTYTKRMTVANVAAAWIGLAAAMWMGAAMASIIAPLMVALIAALLGLYQVVGNLDLRALNPSAPSRRRRARAAGPEEAP